MVCGTCPGEVNHSAAVNFEQHFQRHSQQHMSDLIYSVTRDQLESSFDKLIKTYRKPNDKQQQSSKFRKPLFMYNMYLLAHIDTHTQL